MRLSGTCQVDDTVKPAIPSQDSNGFTQAIGLQNGEPTLSQKCGSNDQLLDLQIQHQFQVESKNVLKLLGYPGAPCGILMTPVARSSTCCVVRMYMNVLPLNALSFALKYAQTK